MFSDVKRYNSFNFYVFAAKDFLDDRFINEHFDFSDNFFFVSFDEVRPLNENLLWRFLDDFLLYFHLDVNRLLNGIVRDNRFVSVLYDVDVLNLSGLDFNRAASMYLNWILFFDDIRNSLLDLD